MNDNEQNSKEKCPVCLETFSSTIKPRFLPCGNYHTVCEMCLQRLISDNSSEGQFPCPVCRQLVQIPSEGVTGFQTNRYIRTSPAETRQKSSERQQTSFARHFRWDQHRNMPVSVHHHQEVMQAGDTNAALIPQNQQLINSHSSPQNYSQSRTIGNSGNTDTSLDYRPSDDRLIWLPPDAIDESIALELQMQELNDSDSRQWHFSQPIATSNSGLPTSSLGYEPSNDSILPPDAIDESIALELQMQELNVSNSRPWNFSQPGARGNSGFPVNFSGYGPGNGGMLPSNTTDQNIALELQMKDFNNSSSRTRNFSQPGAAGNSGFPVNISGYGLGNVGMLPSDAIEENIPLELQTQEFNNSSSRRWKFRQPGATSNSGFPVNVAAYGPGNGGMIPSNTTDQNIALELQMQDFNNSSSRTRNFSQPGATGNSGFPVNDSGYRPGIGGMLPSNTTDEKIALELQMQEFNNSSSRRWNFRQQGTTSNSGFPANSLGNEPSNDRMLPSDAIDESIALELQMQEFNGSSSRSPFDAGLSIIETPRMPSVQQGLRGSSFNQLRHAPFDQDHSHTNL